MGSIAIQQIEIFQPLQRPSSFETACLSFLLPIRPRAVLSLRRYRHRTMGGLFYTGLGFFPTPGNLIPRTPVWPVAFCFNLPFFCHSRKVSSLKPSLGRLSPHPSRPGTFVLLCRFLGCFFFFPPYRRLPPLCINAIDFPLFCPPFPPPQTPPSTVPFQKATLLSPICRVRFLGPFFFPRSLGLRRPVVDKCDKGLDALTRLLGRKPCFLFIDGTVLSLILLSRFAYEHSSIFPMAFLPVSARLLTILSPLSEVFKRLVSLATSWFPLCIRSLRPSSAVFPSLPPPPKSSPPPTLSFTNSCSRLSSYPPSDLV